MLRGNCMTPQNPSAPTREKVGTPVPGSEFEGWTLHTILAGGLQNRRLLSAAATTARERLEVRVKEHREAVGVLPQDLPVHRLERVKLMHPSLGSHGRLEEDLLAQVPG